jgi:hypothetical protein
MTLNQKIETIVREAGLDQSQAKQIKAEVKRQSKEN